MSSTYKRVRAQSTQRRSFTVTAGLVAGYGATGVALHAGVASNTIMTWIAERITAGQPYLTGILTHDTLLYGWAGAGAPEVRNEPVVRFLGEVSVLYAAHVTDGHVTEMLDDVAARLGQALDQTRVYVRYRDTTWVLEREDGEPVTRR